jgi:hypothetical protein
MREIKYSEKAIHMKNEFLLTLDEVFCKETHRLCKKNNRTLATAEDMAKAITLVLGTSVMQKLLE